jgi:hypothetical protein
LNISENKNTIILLSVKPILNPAAVREYQNLASNYSVYLNTLLYSNWIEILSEFKEYYNVIYFLNESDKNHLPKYFLPEDASVIFYDYKIPFSLHDYLLKFNPASNSKTLILFSNGIGLNKKDIFRIFNLIQSDEPSVVIGKTERDQLFFVCTFGIDKDLIDPILESDRYYSRYLSSISSMDIFINTMDNFLSINNFEDIKKLYIELSKKESLSYCSPKMHESFNDLFIEYKDLLNV